MDVPRHRDKTRLAKLDCVSQHLLGQVILQPPHQERLDLDGDGILTCADLLLWTRGAAAMRRARGFALKDRFARPGTRLDVLREDAAGGPVTAVVSTRSTWWRVQIGEEGHQFQVPLPDLADTARAPFPATLWLRTQDTLPVRLHFVLCPGPLIRSIDLVEGTRVNMTVEGLQGSDPSIRVLVGHELVDFIRVDERTLQLGLPTRPGPAEADAHVQIGRPLFVSAGGILSNPGDLAVAVRKQGRSTRPA